MGKLKQNFYNANEAFNYFWDVIPKTGVDFDNTKALFNVGFTLHHPMNNHITSDVRKWNHAYAECEWQWYLTGDPSIDTLGDLYGKIPPIWENMADCNREVRSNYGFQWKRKGQLNYAIQKLKDKKNTRHAVISIFDGKEASSRYMFDTPCTCAIHFHIVDDKLNMSVMMRSNDLWYGFPIDQYCFSKLQQMVAKEVNIPIGTYYHFATNLHIYNDKLKNKI
jgi:thymidylate synthase